jgi:hypothetical protein
LKKSLKIYREPLKVVDRFSILTKIFHRNKTAQANLETKNLTLATNYEIPYIFKHLQRGGKNYSLHFSFFVTYKWQARVFVPASQFHLSVIKHSRLLGPFASYEENRKSAILLIISELVIFLSLWNALELCSDYIPVQFHRPWGITKDNTVWLNAARPPP